VKLGVMTDARRDLLEQIRWAREHAFDFVDIALQAPAAALENTDWVTVRAAVEESGLDVVCHTAPYLPINNPSGAVRQAALDELRRSLDAAHIVGAKLCSVRFAGWPTYLTEAVGYEYYRQMLTILLDHGEKLGIAVALENSPNNAHQLKYFREIFHRLPRLRLAYDVAHANVLTAQSMTRDYMFALADRLSHVHLSDNDGTADDHLALGAPASGGIDLAHEMRTLRSFRYDGAITLQISGDRRLLLYRRIGCARNGTRRHRNR
jgi:sugar phosphate isomerase/epimerase